MKVFLSHQKMDSAKAAEIRQRLLNHHGIDSYLDVIDPYLDSSGQDLAMHIRLQMSKCTQLLAVVSYATRESQWVPWEIGVATEKNFPLATFANYSSAVPEFLRAWPYLKTIDDVDQYAHASKAGQRAYMLKRVINPNEELAKRAEIDTFFSDLRTRLGQPVNKRG